MSDKKKLSKGEIKSIQDEAHTLANEIRQLTQATTVMSFYKVEDAKKDLKKMRKRYQLLINILMGYEETT